MSKTLIWHGTQTEAFELLKALQHQCTCTFSPAKVRLSTCAGHTMLAEDQRVMNHLLFVRRALTERLLHEEFDAVPSQHDRDLARWQRVRQDIAYHSDWGIPGFWRAHPSLGSPIGQEETLGDGVTSQAFSGGIVLWHPDTGATIVSE